MNNENNEPIWPYVIGVLLHVGLFSIAMDDRAMGLFIFVDVIFAIALYHKDK